MDGLKKLRKACQFRQSVGTYLNTRPPGYEAHKLITAPRRSVCTSVPCLLLLSNIVILVKSVRFIIIQAMHFELMTVKLS